MDPMAQRRIVVVGHGAAGLCAALSALETARDRGIDAKVTVFDQLRKQVSILIVEHNLDLVLALADRVFALERGAVFHAGPAEPLLNDLNYRKQILWL